ncbi:type IV pilus biogenesis/stability protein PilW [Vibrio gallicus]|uniref:type IV pilus biogenesis/stability protein PilW n=1 Tax=Vibrio gallicus TaxID=190897 RepID=UPI0021C2818B|nr:type IV pilus biogenesis/stability protein PilW [Vibrio gallicus]
MFKALITLFYLSLCLGCVTVKSADDKTKFAPLAAANARIELGLSYLQLGDTVRAKQNFDIAHQYAPKYVRSSSALAYYYQYVSQVKLAEDWYRRALDLSPDNGNLLNDFGVFLCRQHRYKQALQKFEQAIQQSDYILVAASYENSGLCALQAGQWHQAEAYFIKSLEFQPNRYRSDIELVKLNIRFGQAQLAQQRLNRIHIRVGVTPEVELLQKELQGLQ